MLYKEVPGKGASIDSSSLVSWMYSAASIFLPVASARLTKAEIYFSYPFANDFVCYS